MKSRPPETILKPHDFTREFVVFDLEFTAWEGSMARDWSGANEWREVVEIGAVRIDGNQGFREVGSFRRLVKPTRNPKLSDYLIALTGITQEKLEREAVSFPTALAAFEEFVGTASALSNGSDNDIFDENCDLLGIPRSLQNVNFVNVRPTLALRTGRAEPDVDSHRLPELFGADELSLQAHSAVDDARAIAFALARLFDSARNCA